MIKDLLSHGINIPIGSSNKFTKNLVKMLHQNCNHYGLVNAIWLTIWHCLDAFRLRRRHGLFPFTGGLPQVKGVIIPKRVTKAHFSVYSNGDREGH